MFSEERMLALAAEEAAVSIPPCLPNARGRGGDAGELRGFLDFYTATSNKEFRKMYERVLENKLSAFFRLFGGSLALGTEPADGVRRRDAVGGGFEEVHGPVRKRA